MPVLLTIYHLLHAECLLSRTDIPVCRFSSNEALLSPMDRQECLSYSPFTIYFMQNVFNQRVTRAATRAGFTRRGNVSDCSQLILLNLMLDCVFRNTEAGTDQCFVAFPLIT